MRKGRIVPPPRRHMLCAQGVCVPPCVSSAWPTLPHSFFWMHGAEHTVMKYAAPPAWLRAALDYLPQWLDLQPERYRQPGCSVAIARAAKRWQSWRWAWPTCAPTNTRTAPGTGSCPGTACALPRTPRPSPQRASCCCASRAKSGWTTPLAAMSMACTRTWPAPALASCCRTVRA